MTTAAFPGMIAPRDGGNDNVAGAPILGAGFGENRRQDAGATEKDTTRAGPGTTAVPLNANETQPEDLGANNERLEELRPKLVHALRDLVLQFRQEGIVARRHEIRRIRQARLFWQGMQYAWWNPNDMTWHLPFEQKLNDDTALEEMPRYQFVTNFYQGFGLSFIAVMSQDVPSVRFYPQSAQREDDTSAAKAASEAAKLIEQNNRVQSLLTGVGYYLWTDGKIGGYVRYVADAQRFGSHAEDVIEEASVPLGEDVYLCPQCGAEIPADTPQPAVIPREPFAAAQDKLRDRGIPPEGFPPAGNDGEIPRLARNDNASSGRDNLVPISLCPECGAALGEDNFRAAERIAVPRVVETRRVPNGQEVITIVGGLELNSPVWANEMHEYPYLQWQTEVHRAKLKASYPHAADKIQMGAPQGAEDVYARASRVAVAQGLPTVHPGDALFNLVTFSRTWIRPWSFFALEDKVVRDELLELFPDGCYCAFAGDTYCESRSEAMDDHWRVLHALPGDGQNRPSVGDSLVQVQERYNVLSNIQAETYEFGIPPIYADPQVLDFDALQNQVAEPAAHYPARAKPGQPLAAGFFQPAPARVPPEMLRHQQDLAGPVAQFLTGLFPAVFGGEMSDVKTATGYAMARDQALGRLGLVWRRLKTFYADLMLLGVDCFRKHRPEDAEIPFLGAGGAFESKWIRLADLKGNIQCYAEPDETFPRLKSQQRGVLQQLMASADPMVQRALAEPANLGFIKSVIGLNELVVPGEDSRNKQLREIQVLLASAPILAPGLGSARILAPRSGSAGFQPAFLGASGADGEHRQDAGATGSAGFQPAGLSTAGAGGASLPAATEPALLPSVPVDELLDDHAVEFEECRRWANSDAGQTARAQSPAGFANVRAHAAAHLRALARQAGASAVPPSRT
jgi:hypothetical protein